MLTSRQIKILQIIIDEYIKFNQPVSSKKICEILKLKVSSATIRNETSFLEEKGFLEKTHTSSGKIPSTLAYRFYVDNIIKDNNMFEDNTKKYLECIFKQREGNIDDIMKSASEIISEMTHLTSVITKKDSNKLFLKKIEMIELNENESSVIFIVSNGIIKDKIFKLTNISKNDLKIAIKIFSDYLLNTSIDQIQNSLVDIEKKLSQVIKNWDYILKRFLNTLLNIKENEIHGLKYMLEKPEFSDTVKLKHAIEIIENLSPFDWTDIAYKKNNISNITTKIGKEISDEDDIAMISTELKIRDSSRILSLIGPKRIDYLRVQQIMRLIAEIINKGDENEKK